MSLFYQSATDKENGDSVQIAKQGADNAAAELAQTQELRILVLKYVDAANEIRRRTEEMQARRVEGDKKILELKNEREQAEIKSAQLVRQYF
jgi:predicted ATPase